MNAGDHTAATVSVGADEIVCRSPAMRSVLATVKLIAQSDAGVLLLGESGSGKEVIARAIHQLSRRSGGVFVPINCASLSGEILENELFGHERGAFTSADAQKRGLLEVADGGTLFLDEINEMGLHVQAKLLRVLERREFRRVGGTKKISVDLHIMAATNVDLDAEVRLRRFREDLYYRLKVITLVMPPLRERREDIPLLLDHYLAYFREALGRPVREIGDDALAKLAGYRWPGNVRELANVVERAVILAHGEQIGLRELPPEVVGGGDPDGDRSPSHDFSLRRARRAAESELIRHALRATDGNRTHAAKLLGISHRALLYKLKEYGIRD
jgi:two-component system response regulator AtoC